MLMVMMMDTNESIVFTWEMNLVACIGAVRRAPTIIPFASTFHIKLNCMCFEWSEWSVEAWWQCGAHRHLNTHTYMKHSVKRRGIQHTHVIHTCDGISACGERLRNVRNGGNTKTVPRSTVHVCFVLVSSAVVLTKRRSPLSHVTLSMSVCFVCV